MNSSNRSPFDRDADVQKAMEQMKDDLEWQEIVIEMLEVALGRAVKMSDFRHFEWIPEKKGFAVASRSALEAELRRRHDHR